MAVLHPSRFPDGHVEPLSLQTLVDSTLWSYSYPRHLRSRPHPPCSYPSCDRAPLPSHARIEEDLTSHRPSTLRGLPIYLGLVLVFLFSFWPMLVMALEGADIDLGPIFSGRGISYVAGVPYYSGGIYPSLANYRDALLLGNFPRLVFNSTSIAVLSIAIALAAGVTAGYTLARSKLRGIGAIGFLLLALRTVSPFAIILPLYLTYV